MKANLKFINRSNDVNNTDVVIFQKPTSPDWNMETIAWTVIKNCGRSDSHDFDYDYDLEVSGEDSYGNVTAKIPTSPGDKLEMIKDQSGDVLRLTEDKASNPLNVVVANHLYRGSFDANCYRSGKLLSKKTNIVPKTEAIFKFKPHIYIGVIYEIEEGETMDSAVVKEINSNISLEGIKSADIVMYGGGFGKDSVPYTFRIENAVHM